MAAADPIDPVAYAADLHRRAETMYAAARAQARALESLGVTVTQGDLTIEVAPGGVMTGVTVDEAASPSPTGLTRAFAEAYTEAIWSVTRSVAEHSGGLADEVGGMAPTPPDGPGQRPEVHRSDTDEEPQRPEPLPADAAFEALLATLDDGPDDLEAFVNHPTFVALRPQGEPHTWQRDLEREVQALTAHADQLAEAARTVRGEHDDALLQLEVGTEGRVERLVFKEAVRRTAPDQIGTAVMTAYAAARTEARRRLDEVTQDITAGGGDELP